MATIPSRLLTNSAAEHLADHEELRVQHNAVEGDWIDTGTTHKPSQFTIGNGTFVTKYKQMGKILFVRMQFTLGSTSSIAAGDWAFGLPVAAKGCQSGTCLIRQTDGKLVRGIALLPPDVQTYYLLHFADNAYCAPNSLGGFATPTTGHIISANLVLEAV